MPLAEDFPGQRKPRGPGNRIAGVQLKNRGLASALEKEREVNSKLKNEIILLKQRDLKHFEDLSACKCVIASLANKLSQIQMIANEACSLAERSVEYKGFSSSEKKNQTTHCIESPQHHTHHHNHAVNRPGVGELQSKPPVVETGNSRPHSTPLVKTSTCSRRLRGQQWKANAIFPTRRLSDLKQLNQNPHILSMPSVVANNTPKNSQTVSGETRTADNVVHSTFDLHSPRAPYEGDTPSMGSARASTVDTTTLPAQLSPNLPTVNEDVAAMCEIQNQIQRLSIGSLSYRGTGTQLPTAKSPTASASTAYSDENSYRSTMVRLPSCRRAQNETDSLPRLSDITNIAHRHQLRTRSAVPSLDNSIVQRAGSASHSTGMQVNGLAGVTVVPTERKSKARATDARRRSQSSGNVSATANSLLPQHKSTPSKKNGYVLGGEGIAVRKSSRQCVSKTVSYKEEPLNAKKRREDTFGTDPFFIDAWRSKLNGSKVKINKK